MSTLYRDLLPLAKLAPLVGETHHNLHQWVTVGANGHKLRGLKIGGRWKSSVAWFGEWVRLTNDLDAPPPDQRHGGPSQAVLRELDQAGIV